MAQARITPKASSDGTITLAEAPAYAQLAPQERFVEYMAVNLFMAETAKKHGASQDLINSINLQHQKLSSAYMMHRRNGNHTFTDLPTHDAFVAVVNEYNAWASAQSLNLSPTNTAPVVDPSVPPAPSTTVHETTTVDDASATPATVVETPDSSVENEPSNSDLLNAINAIGGRTQVVEDRSNEHHVTLYGDEAGKSGLVARVEALENGNVLHSDGTSVPWRSRTVAVGNYDLKVMPAILAFIVTYALLIFISWVIDTDTGFWATIGYWQAGFAAAVAALVLLVTNIHRNTAPAVEREERV